MKILHLSQSDINTDSRILKEMLSLKSYYKDSQIFGIGVEMNEKALSEKVNKLHISSIKLNSYKLRHTPKILVYILAVFEISSKMFFMGLKFKPDIIHCHDTPALPLAITLKLFTKAKIIYDAHELESNRNGLSKTLGKMTLFVERILWRFLDALIVVSFSIDKWYENNIGEKRSEIILNSPVLEKNTFLKDRSYLRKKFSIPKDSKIFIYVGLFGEGRCIDLIVDVFKNSNINSSLVLLGYGEMSNKLKKLAEECSNIYVHDAVSHDGVVTIAQSADVGLCLIQNISLSDYYCLPNKLFEYSFAKIPILASDFPDISFVLKKYNLGKCSQLDSKSIFNAIKELEDAKELPKINVNNLYDLSWRAQEYKLIKLYEELIKQIKNSKDN